jgi:hypothetical protein
MQEIPLAMEMKQRLLHQAGKFGLMQDAGSVAGIEPGLDARSSCRILFVCWEFFEFVFDAYERLFCEAVGKMESYVLNELRALDMGKVAASMAIGV